MVFSVLSILFSWGCSIVSVCVGLVVWCWVRLCSSWVVMMVVVCLLLLSLVWCLVIFSRCI